MGSYDAKMLFCLGILDVLWVALLVSVMVYLVFRKVYLLISKGRSITGAGGANHEIS